MVDKRFQDVLLKAACWKMFIGWRLFCIGKVLPVVTDRGPIPIQDVATANEQNGAEWVCRREG